MNRVVPFVLMVVLGFANFVLAAYNISTDANILLTAFSLFVGAFATASAHRLMVDLL